MNHQPASGAAEPELRALYDAGRASPGQALALFDSLKPVDTRTMRGRWQGSGFVTGHPLDGVLENYSWYGKEFHDDDHVHPLLFRSFGGQLYRVHPRRMPLELALKLPFRRAFFMRLLFMLLRPLLGTRQHRARLRPLEHRGVVTAAMIYDDLPIIDVFRQLDQDHVLGVMDLRGIDQPFFFRLRRTGEQAPGP